MTEKEYFSEINRIRAKIKESNIESVENELDDFFDYKPVRLLWYVAKVEYLFEIGQTMAAFELLQTQSHFMYSYPGMEEFWEIRTKIYERLNNQEEVRRCRYYLNKMQNKVLSEEMGLVNNAIKSFLNDESSENLVNLCWSYHITNNLVMSFLLMLEMEEREISIDSRLTWLYGLPNYGYLKEKVTSNEKEVFIFVADNQIGIEADILNSILGKRFGHKVFVVQEPVMIDVEVVVNLQDTLRISLENAIMYGDTCIIPPVRIFLEGKDQGDNREYIIDYICREETKNDLAVVLTSGNMFDSLRNCPKIRNRIERLSPPMENYFAEVLDFGWTGDYLSYVSEIYQCNVREDMNYPSSCDFSIIIPTRNYGNCLEHTLLTCLDQDYDGEYEIILSDNSTEGNTHIYDIYTKINSSKIRYVRTPRNLPLSKSFEFAFLKARGKFLFSIGADDAVLPWALRTLKAVMQQYPDDLVIQWERGFYAWPGFNGTQENQFTIPNKYIKGNYGAYYMERNMYIRQIYTKPELMYNLPNMYLNSGMKRENMKYMYERTGGMWDGCNQDLYMGILNVAIHPRILNIQYPITIAGMSNTSLGYVTGVNKKVNQESEKIAKSSWMGDNVGIYNMTSLENTVPVISVDTAWLYLCILRIYSKNILSSEVILEGFRFEKMFQECFERCSYSDEKLDIYIRHGMHAAKSLGDKYENWFIENIYNQLTKPVYIKKKEPEKLGDIKAYEESYREEIGFGTLDASKYEVTNIKEACELFQKLVAL